MNVTDSRMQMVRDAFQQVASGADSCSFEQLCTCFRASEHPRTTSREKTADVVAAEFRAGMSKYVEGGHVTCDAFCNYYLDFNCVLPWEKDSYFAQAVNKSWGLSADTSAVSAQRVAQLESIVFEKIRQRTHGADDEGKTVKRFFKHFDLKGYGTIGAAEFKQAMEALGCVFNTNELAAIFRKYDTNSSGKLDFEEFAGMMALRGTGNNPNVNPVFGLTREPPHQILDKIRSVLRSKGLYGIRELVALFKRFDTNADSKLDRHETQWVLKQNGQNLTPSEFERIFKYFDKNGDGYISISEFVRGVRGELNQKRSAVVADCWSRIAPQGELPCNDFAAAFNLQSVAEYRNG